MLTSIMSSIFFFFLPIYGRNLYRVIVSLLCRLNSTKELRDRYMDFVVRGIFLGRAICRLQCVPARFK